MTVTIAIRPVTITGQVFHDGVSVFTSATLRPIPAWGIFVEHTEGTMSGLAPDRTTALKEAQKMAEDHGWKLVYIAPEEEGPLSAEGGRLQ